MRTVKAVALHTDEDYHNDEFVKYMNNIILELIKFDEMKRGLWERI